MEERQSVLVVDDDEQIRKLLQNGLKPFGFDVRTAQDTDCARELLRTSPVSLVLCDQDMPGGCGLDLLRYTSRLYPHLPFIMVTGRDEIGLARESIAAGAQDYVTKPFQIKSLVRRIEQSQEHLARDRRRLAEVTEEVLGGAIRALVAAIDAKDPYTARHSERVTALAARMGEAMGLRADVQLLLTYSSLLHDVGKIAVPEAILTKRGKLTEEEWEIIRQHPARSAEILSHAPALAQVATVVRHHHERLDGRGYPDQLAGEAIPLLSRVITIVDVYEALTSERSYRGAMSPSEAKTIIREGAGTQFDPELAGLFDGLADLP